MGIEDPVVLPAAPAQPPQQDQEEEVVVMVKPQGATIASNTNDTSNGHVGKEEEGDDEGKVPPPAPAADDDDDDDVIEVVTTATATTTATTATAKSTNVMVNGESGEGELVRSLRRKIEELEKENTRLKAEAARSRWPISSSNATATATAAAQPPAKKAKTAGAIKKSFEKWARALVKAVPKEKFGMYGEDKKVIVKEGAAMAKEEFDELFKNKGGKLIQPTPQNKPTSVITIINFPDYASVKRLFGDADIPESGYQATVWRQRAFQKAMKWGERDAKIASMEACYNRSKMSLELHFWMEPTEGGVDDCCVM